MFAGPEVRVPPNGKSKQSERGGDSLNHRTVCACIRDEHLSPTTRHPPRVPDTLRRANAGTPTIAPSTVTLSSPRHRESLPRGRVLSVSVTFQKGEVVIAVEILH